MRYGAFDAVAVDVEDGVVKLRGWVDNPYKKEEIEELLAQVDGLRDVHNDLRVQGFSSGDRQLRREIFRRIYRDPMFERWANMPDPPVRVFVETRPGHPRRHRRQRGREAGRAATSRAARSPSASTTRCMVESERPSEDRKKDDAS